MHEQCDFCPPEILMGDNAVLCLHPYLLPMSQRQISEGSAWGAVGVGLRGVAPPPLAPSTASARCHSRTYFRPQAWLQSPVRTIASDFDACNLLVICLI